MFLNRLVLCPYLIRRYTDAKIMKLFRIRRLSNVKNTICRFFIRKNLVVLIKKCTFVAKFNINHTIIKLFAYRLDIYLIY